MVFLPMKNLLRATTLFFLSPIQHHTFNSSYKEKCEGFYQDGMTPMVKISFFSGDFSAVCKRSCNSTWQACTVNLFKGSTLFLISLTNCKNGAYFGSPSYQCMKVECSQGKKAAPS